MSESVTVTVTRSITAAAGVYAPGHLGELTQYLPFELVDDVLSDTKTVQRRLRDLPSRVGVYFVLALMLFSGLGYARVWRKLTAGLVGLELPSPSEKALRDLRRRLGPAPFKALFEVVAGPLGQPHTPGVCYRGMRTVAFDGCNSLKVPDTDRNRSWLGRIRYRMGFAGYPMIRMMALIETGTRAILGATLGSAGDRDEAALARRLLPLLQPNMLVLLDRAFDAAGFCKELHGTSAKFLVRSRATRRPPVLAQLSDGSFLSDLHGLSMRIIDAELTVTGADGSHVRDRYRLITTLLDHDNHPAAELLRLYHERWEIEIAYLGLRHTILNGRVLRSQDRAGLEQEIWALLTVYQLLRMAMVTAVESQPDTNPDRASFTTALQAARDQLVAADGILPADTDLLGVIGRAILGTLLPPRRPRWSTRKVKNATSRYLNRADGRPDLPTTITAIDIALYTPSVDASWRPRYRKPANPHAAPTRRQRATALMEKDPRQPWCGRDLAKHLGIKPRNMLTQLAEWTRLGFLTRTSTGSYALPTRRDAQSP
jgi:Insertion element 4 transposase N-terminal/Transposase DDE domain